MRGGSSETRPTDMQQRGRQRLFFISSVTFSEPGACCDHEGGLE